MRACARVCQVFITCSTGDGIHPASHPARPAAPGLPPAAARAARPTAPGLPAAASESGPRAGGAGRLGIGALARYLAAATLARGADAGAPVGLALLATSPDAGLRHGVA